jgi:riboflavin kinase/FMN adenylyltransferase
MRIYKELGEFLELTKPVVTIGTFDGVHVGHQKILSRLKAIAAQNGGQVVVLTFDPHPRKVLFPDQKGLFLLTSMPEKVRLLEKYGVQHLVIQPFSIEFSKLSHHDFIQQIVVEQLKVDTLVVGYDHQFGHNREGSFRELKELAPILGFKVEEIPEQDIDEIAISSTRIRKALQEGQIESANQLLGYTYSLQGTVVKGNQIGRTLGFPTANLKPFTSDKLIPAVGVYAVSVAHGEQYYKGVLSIGNRPTFDNGALSIEVNIFNFDTDIYNDEITIFIHHFIRTDLKFASVDDLVMQMHKDKAKSMELLAQIDVKNS